MAALLITASGLPLRAQNCTSTAINTPCSTAALPVRITIGRAIRLVASPAITTLAVPTPAIFNAGFALANGPTLTLKANTPWSLAISAETALWSATDTGTEPAWTAKPAAELGWSNVNGGPYAAMSLTPATVGSGSATSGTNIPLYFRTAYTWTNDTPGNYQLRLILTITAP